MDAQEDVMDTSVDVTPKEGFRIDQEDCTFGQVMAKGRYKPKSNFIIELETYVEAGSHTGFFAWVTRRSDRLRKLCYYSMDSLFVKQRFLSELRMTFGFGGLNCSLNDRDLADFHNFLEKDFPFNDPGKTKYGASCVGLQPRDERLHANDVWILNPEIHVNANGNQIELQSSDYVWLPIGGPYIESSYSKNASYKIDIRSEVKTPLESRQSLSLLLSNMKSVLKHNFIPGLFTLGSAVMGVHFEALVERQGGCPLPMIIGEPETGKSTAAKCALSLCGQHHAGNIMKTKATSDSICTERMTHSTLPFLLDDPKSPKEIGELLITLYDGAFSGNMLKGLRKPRTMPIFSCNFSTISSIQRYASRSLVIPFQLPVVGPTDEKETKEFRKLPETMTNASSAVGWVISLGQDLKQGKQFEGDMLKKVSAKLRGVNSRLCTSYTTLLYCVKKIAEEAGQIYLVNEAEDFLSDILPFIVTTDAELLKSNLGCNQITPVLNCVSSLVVWALQKKQEGRLCEVLQSVRTGVSFQGKHSLAVVLDDIRHLKFCDNPHAIRQCIKDNNLGKINIAKDFLPAKSSNMVIKRGENSHSRKCVVVKLDTLPQELQKQVIEATTLQTASNETTTSVEASTSLTASNESDQSITNEASNEIDQHATGLELSPEIESLLSDQDLIVAALEQSEGIESENPWNSSENSDLFADEDSLIPDIPTLNSDQQVVALQFSASLPPSIMQPTSKVNNSQPPQAEETVITKEQEFKVLAVEEKFLKTGQEFSGQMAIGYAQNAGSPPQEFNAEASVPDALTKVQPPMDDPNSAAVVEALSPPSFKVSQKSSAQVSMKTPHHEVQIDPKFSAQMAGGLVLPPQLLSVDQGVGTQVTVANAQDEVQSSQASQEAQVVLPESPKAEHSKTKAKVGKQKSFSKNRKRPYPDKRSSSPRKKARNEQFKSKARRLRSNSKV